MTWEEKIKKANKKAGELLNVEGDYQESNCRTTKIFGTAECCSSPIKGALQTAIKAVNEGEKEKLQEVLPLVKNQLEVLKLLTKVYFSYPGEKTIIYRRGVDGTGSGYSCGIHLLLRFRNGELVLDFPDRMLNFFFIGPDNRKIVNNTLLVLSRFVRDAEIRCSKHPRHQTV